MSLEPMPAGAVSAMKGLSEAFRQMRESQEEIIAALGRFNPALRACLAGARFHRKGRCGRVRRSLPRNYRARSKQ